MLRRIWAMRSLDIERIPHDTTILHRCLSSPAITHNDEDHREARTWLARFHVNTIPKNICEVTFSRSSGPGGQNVNKFENSHSLHRKTSVLIRSS